MRVMTVQGIREVRKKKSDIWRSFEQPLRRVAERDTEIQNTRCAQGGTISGEMLPEAQAAYMQIARRRDPEIEALGEQHRPAIVRGHDELLTKTAEGARALAVTLRELVEYQTEMGACFQETGQPQRYVAGNPDLALGLENLVRRIEQIQAPPKPAARRQAQQAPVRPADFSDLLLQ